MKRIISTLLVLSMFMSMSIAAVSIESEAKRNYLNDVVKGLVSQSIVSSKSSNGKYYIGNKIYSYKIEQERIAETDYELYPVFADDKIVTVVQLSQNDTGAYSACCFTSIAENVQKYFERNHEKETCIIYAHEGIYVYSSDNEMECIQNVENTYLSPLNINRVEREALKFNTINKIREVEVQVVHSRAKQHMTLSVPFVSNQTSICSNEDCDGVWMCWAASIAMIINYYRGTSYTARNVHDATGCYSTAIPANYMSALRTLGAYAYGPYYSFSFTNALTLVQGGHPAFMRIEREVSNGVNEGHAIVPYGYHYDPDNSPLQFFLFMDPNYGGGIASFPSSGDLEITTDGSTYVFDYYIGTSW